MSNITNYLRDELYPSLFGSIGRAFPEHNFETYRGGWRSQTYLDGTKHENRRDKTIVTKTAPGFILEQGGAILSLVDYVMSRDKVDLFTAIKTLADVAGLQIPEGLLSDPETYQRYKDKTTLLEDCNSYFIYCLETSPGAEDVRAYLSSRGYSLEEAKAMELGYIPSQDKLFKYLTDPKNKKEYSQELISETLQLIKGIGSTHKLTIPYRSGGSIKGFKFRTVGEATPKYLNSTGLDKSGGFFNLLGIKGAKDVVIVEGELDSLHATVKGVENVVALGGSSINSEQVRDAKRRGAQSFTLCLDTEPGKEEETAKRVNTVIEVILGEGINKVYIVTLPALGGIKTDPDRLIKESGVDSFKKAIAQALPYWEYKLLRIFNKYAKIQEERSLQPKEIDYFLQEIVETATSLPDATDRDRFKKYFLSQEAIKPLGITEESLSITVDKITSTRDKESQAKEFKKLLSEATALQEKGEVTKALEILDSRVKEVKLKDKATEFSKLLVAPKETEVRGRLSSKPESLNSGYTIEKEPLLLPSGALSIFTAPTSHGKTTLLINLLLNVATAKGNQDKEFYLFSYEEDGDSILMNALNIYLDEDISINNRKTLRSYFTTGSTQYIKTESKASFLATKDKFFKELIEPRRANILYTSYNSDELIEAIRYLHKNANVGGIFIDYFQLLNSPQGKYKTYSRQEELKQICLNLKDVAVETGLPITLGAQFNREVVNQLRLHATKIGEAGDIERIANLIVGFWNNNFKPLGTDGEIEEINNMGAYRPETLYTTILKNRGGRVGLSELLSFNGNTGKIKNRGGSSFMDDPF